MLDDESLAYLADVTKNQLAADFLVLRKLWMSVQDAHTVIEQAKKAYVTSRKLLDQIDGAPTQMLEPVE